MSEPARWKACLPFAVMVLLALIEPLTHAWLLYGPVPDGQLPSGVHTGDSSHHLVCMKSFANGFASPFATCHAESSRDFGYFAVPIFLLYGVLGEVGRMLALDPLLMLGLANGVGGFLLLWNVYRFFRRIAPQHATRAFYLYALGGGVGGVLFLLAWIMGATQASGFEAWFFRFAQYELIEGQHLAPVLLMPRFYYTLPLALGFAALTALVETDWCRCPGHLFFTCFLLFITACLNLRLGPLFWAIGGLYLLAGSPNDRPYRLKLAIATLMPVIAGSAIFLALLWQHPSYQGNVAAVTRTSMLLLPFLFTTLFHGPALARGIQAAHGSAPPPIRWAVVALCAWLLAYGTIYLGHQVWYGNWWRGGDAAAAIIASDGAVVLFLPMLFIGWLVLRKKTPAPAPGHLDWVVLWFLGLLAVAMLAIGQGWFLSLSPQRCMVLLGPPLALMAAAGLQHMAPRWARINFATIVGCGIVATTVAALWFQGPAGASRQENGPFAYLHYAYMSADDAYLIDRLPEGTIAVPPWSPIAFGEILVHHGDYQVLGGPGAMNLGDQPFGPLQEAVNRFFSDGASVSDREAFLATWCVDYIYCPDSCPVDEQTLFQIEKLDRVTLIARKGNGRLFQVR